MAATHRVEAAKSRYMRVYVRVPAIERFMAKVHFVIGGCWEWQGARDPNGYGRFGDENRKSVLAHRWSYGYFKGPIPWGLHVDHLCFTPSCVNPMHLEAVTPLVNTRRAFAAHRRAESWSLFCSHGHRRTRDTVRLDPRGSVHCKVCDKENSRKRSERRRRTRVANLGFDPGPKARYFVKRPNCVDS